MKQVTYSMAGETHAGFMFDDCIIISARDGTMVPVSNIEKMYIEEWHDLEEVLLKEEMLSKEFADTEVARYKIRQVMPLESTTPYAIWDRVGSTYLISNENVLTFASYNEARDYLRDRGMEI